MSAAYERPTRDEMIALGRQLWGEPNKDQSNRREVRFGSNGSKCIKLEELVWFDHEAGEGGGYSDLCRKVHRGPPKAEPQGGNSHKKPSKRIVATYAYHAADGELRFEVVRYEPKKFSQRRPDGNGGYVWNLKGIDRIPYRLPELIAADAASIVFIPEGEKHVDALIARDLVATTNPGGAGKWHAQYNEYLRNRDVVVLADHDQAGQDHAANVASNLRDIARSVRVLLLPDLPPKGDVVDWLNAGHTAAELTALAAGIEIITPDPPPPPTDDDPSVSEVIAEFNAKFMVVNDGGRTVIFREATDSVLHRHYFERIRFEDFRGLFLNIRVKTGQDENGKPKYGQAADLWLRSRKRRQYVNGVLFDPTGNTPAGTLNLWRGFGVEQRSGSWQRLKDHLLNVICSGDAELSDYVLNWAARLLQFPAEQGEVAIVMRGIEGCGKGVFARALKRILGQHGLGINNPKHLTGVFNAHLRDCVFLFADECFFAGDKAHIGVLKAIITEPTITIEGKYQNAIEAPNFLHVIMASNEEWVVPASLNSRRFLVLDVPAVKAGNLAYFDEIYKELDAGGYEAMLHELLHRDISQFNPRSVPVTKGLEEQRKLSLPTHARWWQDVLFRGYVFISKHGLESHFSVWHDELSTELLYASYLAFARDSRERHPYSRETFGRFLVQAAKARPKRLKSAIVGEHVITKENPMTGGTSRCAEVIIHPRPHGYHLGDLPKCRIAFEVETGLVFEWPEDADGD